MTSSRVGRFFVATGLVLGTGCAVQAPSEGADVSVSNQALTVIDCQTAAAECLGVLPSAQTITQCRDEFNACLGDVATDAQSQADGLTACRDAAMSATWWWPPAIDEWGWAGC